MQKIYAQRYKGKYRKIKDIISISLLLIYMLGSWLPYYREFDMPNQALLIDLPGRKAYIFNIIIWPEELYYLTFALILSALGLFICTSLFGRLWCGYACPHTTLVDIFMQIEYFIQGDRNARIKLDQMELNAEKFIKKFLTYLIWLMLSFMFAFGWVSYFYESRLLLHDVINLCVTKNGIAWLFGLTLSTYLLGGFLREKVCMHMCPYGKFQSGLIDENTILVTYHDWRGETIQSVQGDCINCHRCEFACPMGIDIRNGLQMPCIGCGLCIDACNDVMQKMKRKPDLIEYTSVNRTKILQNNHNTKQKSIITPKVLFYSSVFTIIFCVLIFSLFTKSDFIFKIDKINSPLFTLTPDGTIRNNYKLTVVNKTSIIKNDVCIFINENFVINIQNIDNNYTNKVCFSLNPGEILESQMFVKLLTQYNTNDQYIKINFRLNDEQNSGIFYLKK